ncbi:MAG: hypothetical protein LM563_06025 [Thermofilum sp.]|jgi:hypothetical protein|nr:hypothetical protein [Thermofilum sp.]
MPVRELLVILALVAATAAAAYAVLRGLSAQPGHRFEEAYELKKALLAGRLSGVTVSVEARPMTINLTLDDVEYRVPAARVYVVLRAPSPVFEEAAPEPWRVWGNGTHAGVISYLDVLDDGYTVRARYFSATPYRGASVCTSVSAVKQVQFHAKTSGKVEWYSFTGPRQVVVEEVRVGPCQQ